MELLIQDLLENYFKKNDINYKREYSLGSCRIDFVVSMDGKSQGVEVKSSYSDVFAAIGQLINFSRYFSHLHLVAPQNFLDKITKIMEETSVLRQMGIFLFEDGNFIHIKKPTTEEYYFRGAESVGKKKQLYASGINEERFTDSEIKFFREFKNKPFMIYEAANETNRKLGATYIFVNTLRKLGLVEVVDNTSNPRSYRITNKLIDILRLSKQT